MLVLPNSHTLLSHMKSAATMCISAPEPTDNVQPHNHHLLAPSPGVPQKEHMSCTEAPNAPKWSSSGQRRVVISPRLLIICLLLVAACSFYVGLIMLSVVVSHTVHLYPSPRAHAVIRNIRERAPSPCLSTEVLHQEKTAIDQRYLNQSFAVVGKDTIITTDQKEKENRNDSGHDNRRVYSTSMVAEALVNPAMITHPNPKRVAIMGDKAGASLREVLKHRSVEEVVILATDEEALKVGSENGCATIKAACAPSCSMDSKASLIVEDPHKWTIDSNAKVDVFIMNHANISVAGDPTNDLNYNDQFATSLLNKLSDDGVFAVDFGEFDGHDKYASEIDQVRDNFLVTLKRAGFQSMHTYEEAHVQFLVSFKDYESRANWYMTSSEISIELHKRIYKGTQSREPSFLLFDAPTMVRYQVPPKDHETMYCDQDEEPWECDEYAGIDPETLSIPLSHLTAKKSGAGEFAGRGLFAAEDIPEGSTFDVASTVKSFYVMPSTWSVIETLDEWADDIDNHVFANDEISSMYTFIDGYGYKAILLGKKHYTIDSSITGFCNHGCNGTYNFGDDDTSPQVTESNFSLNQQPESLLNAQTSVYSPMIERHLRQLMSVGDNTLRDIKQGEEIFCNYLSYVGDPDDWEKDILGLRNQCAGDTRGEIAEYEHEHEI